MATTKSDTKVVTGEVRLSYVHLLEPYAQNEGQDPKYSCVILVPKSDEKTISAIKAAQKAALIQGKDSRFNGKIPQGWKNTFRDGDTDDSVDHERNPEYAGHMYMSVSSKTRPGIVDKALNPVLDADKIYSGLYARVSINCFPYSVQGNKGVSFGLNNVMIVRDGDYLGGRASAESDFADFKEEFGGDEEDEFADLV